MSADLEKRRPWDQMPDESDTAYQHFRDYLMSGARGQRSVRALAKQRGLNRDNLAQLSARWQWIDRCRAFDADLDALEEAEIGDKRRRLAREVIVNADAMVTGAGNALAASLRSLTKIMEADAASPDRVLAWDEALDGLRIAARVTAQAHAILGPVVDDIVDDGTELGHGLDVVDLANALLQLASDAPAETITPAGLVQADPDVIDVEPT